jgi:hypothetical protein
VMLEMWMASSLPDGAAAGSTLTGVAE